MLTKIVHNSPKLCAFLEPLIESLSAPQRQHSRDLCDALLVCESEHTLAALQRQFVETTDASNWADFLRISPWNAQRVRAELLEAQISFAIEEGQKSCQAREIYLNIDDSIGEKHRDTWRLEVVDIHHDHTNSTPKHPRYINGFCYVVCTMRVGDVAVTLDFQLYLRKRTVRAINRTREPDERIHFRSKNTIAREMLKRIAPLLPEGWMVIVQFDSWYASNKILKFVHRRKRQQWEFTCGVKFTRKLNGVSLDTHHRKLKHKVYTPVSVKTAEGKTNYFVRCLDGRFTELPIDLRVLISQRRKGQKYPAYFASTRIGCKPQAILQGYSGRWSCEVVNFYTQRRLGVEDFRLWRYEAVDRYLVAVALSWAYVEQRFVKERGPEIKCHGDLIRRHREEHAEAWLIAALKMAQDGATLDQVLQRFLRREPEVE
jgi:hypothetical protein